MKFEEHKGEEQTELERKYERMRMYAAILLAAATTFSFFFKLVFF
jgi:hypothetical protein